MTDGELVVFLHDLARKEESVKNFRIAEAIREAADRLAELAKNS